MAVTLHGSAMVVFLMAVVALGIKPPEGAPKFGLESPLIGGIGALVSLALARAGRLRSGSIVFLVSFTLGVAASFVRSGTFYTPAVGAMVLTVLLAALLLGARAALVATACVVALLTGLEEFFHHSASQSPVDWVPRGLSALWWLPTFLTAGMVAALAASRVQGALDDADRSEAELKRQNRALADNEERYRSLVHNNPLGVITLDRELRIETVNAELLRLTGAPSAADFVGHNLAEFPAFAAVDVRWIHQQLDAGKRADLEASWTSLWGRPLHVRIYLAPIRDTRGETIGAQVIVGDVSEQKQLEAQLLQSQKMEATGRLAGGVAHDFNNYLTAILGNAELLLQKHDDDAELREPLEQIVQAAERSSAVTRQLLAFARKQVVQPRLVDPNWLIEELAPMLERLAGPTRKLDIVLPSDAGVVRVDPSQLEVVLVNLVTNARDAMPDGGLLQIETEGVLLDAESAAAVSLEPGSYVQIRVTDSGLGMDADTRSRVFEPFFTTKPTGLGTGLGLATAHGVVTQSGGALVVESELGRGSSFRILLPRLSGEGATGDRAAPRGPLPRGSETILLVEDERAVRATARAMLGAHGYTVVEAEDAERALELAAGLEGGIDLLVTDVAMPGMGGVELASRLRARQPGLPVLFVSGYAEPVVNGGGLGPDAALLQKPFTTEKLLVQVRARLEGMAPS